MEKAGDVNPLLEAAQNIGEKTIEDDSNSNATASDTGEVDNGIGSYERFMHSFGSPARWAGR